MKLVHRGPNDPEPKSDRFASGSCGFDSSDCYGSLYVDYDVVVLDAAIDGTLDMGLYADEVQHPHPSTGLSFVERIREHPQRVYDAQLKTKKKWKREKLTNFAWKIEKKFLDKETSSLVLRVVQKKKKKKIPIHESTPQYADCSVLKRQSGQDTM